MFKTHESKLALATLALSGFLYFLEKTPGLHFPEIRALLGALFVLVPPGYLLTSALFPHGQLSHAEKAALSLFASYASVSLAYLLANRFGLGFTFTHSLLLIDALSLAFYAAYLIRFHLKGNPAFLKLRKALEGF